MEKKFTVEITQETANYLQRLGMEVDGKVYLIDRMFANHANDEDTSLFDSVPFQHYMKEYEQALYEWDLAKQEFQDSYLTNKVKEITGQEDVSYTWAINDFSLLECEITLS